jgi:hypothetical protein
MGRIGTSAINVLDDLMCFIFCASCKVPSDWHPSAGRPSAAVHVLLVESCLQKPDFCHVQAASDIRAQISRPVVAPRHDSALRRPSHTKHAGCDYAFTVSCAVHHQRRGSCHLRAAQLQRVPHLKLPVSPERHDPPPSTLGSLSTSGPLSGSVLRGVKTHLLRVPRCRDASIRPSRFHCMISS